MLGDLSVTFESATDDVILVREDAIYLDARAQGKLKAYIKNAGVPVSRWPGSSRCIPWQMQHSRWSSH